MGTDTRSAVSVHIYGRLNLRIRVDLRLFLLFIFFDDRIIHSLQRFDRNIKSRCQIIRPDCFVNQIGLL